MSSEGVDVFGKHLVSVAGPELLLGAFETGHWVPGAGDPTAVGWATTAGYALGAILCFWVAIRRWSANTGKNPISLVKFWLIIGIIMSALAINKQLDLQMWLWQTGREFAKVHGFYEERRIVQLVSMSGIAIIAMAIFYYLRRLTRGASRDNALALFGVVFILSFVVIRATSFHHVDVVLGSNVGTLKVNSILENGGILLVTVAALLALRKLPSTHYVRFQQSSGISPVKNEPGPRSPRATLRDSGPDPIASGEENKGVL